MTKDYQTETPEEARARREQFAGAMTLRMAHFPESSKTTQMFIAGEMEAERTAGEAHAIACMEAGEAHGARLERARKEEITPCEGIRFHQEGWAAGYRHGLEAARDAVVLVCPECVVAIQETDEEGCCLACGIDVHRDENDAEYPWLQTVNAIGRLIASLPEEP
jgi:hypothetical protein